METRSSRWLVGAWLAWCGLAQAQAPLPKDAYCARPIKLALYEYGVLYMQSRNDGVDARVADLLAARTGCTIEKVVLPRARIWNELRAGRVDVATGAVVTPERRSLAYMPPYLRSRNLVLLRRDIGTLPTSLAEFEAGKLRLGALRGGQAEGVHSEWLQRIRRQGRVIEGADAEELMRMLEKGVVSAVFTQIGVYQRYFAPSWLEQELAVMDWAPKDEAVTVTLALSRTSFTPEQARRWDQLLDTLSHDGSLLKILRDFVSADEARSMVYNGPRDPN